ncbi:MAG: LacI family transcriptional regulator [Cyclobacteriaceae bacterium]|nr:LacI family DNA-binding transcriptional regulator [Cyclobacteriaceae bacterium]MCH8516723.1 LacI family transcriptional regulator [Cyclobacteriaceae bacterium]
MKKSTIKDISILAQVNPSTVSRALNNHPDISNDLKNKIKKIAEDLNYVPNKLAANFRSNSTKTIALIIPEFTMFFFPSVIKGINKVVTKMNYQLMVFHSNDESDIESNHIKACIDNRVSGIIISLSSTSKDLNHIDKAIRFGIPVIFFDKAPSMNGYNTVKINDINAAYKAIKFLKEAQITRIAGIFGHPNISITKDRITGFHKAVLEYKMEAIGICHPTSWQNIYDLTTDYLKQGVEGIFCMSDEILSAVTPAVAKYKEKNATNVKIICISDGQLPYFYNEEVNFIHHDGEWVGIRAAEMLFERLQDENSRSTKMHIIETPLKTNQQSS